MVDRPRAARVVAALACALIAPGCAFVPRTRLDDAQKVVQSLRTENAQLRDVSVTLKTQNQDLTQRAVDDADALLEAARLEPLLESDGRRVFGSMVSVYQALLDEIKRLDGDVLTTRVRLSRWRKMRIASRWLFRPPADRFARVVHLPIPAP